MNYAFSRDIRHVGIVHNMRVSVTATMNTKIYCENATMCDMCVHQLYFHHIYIYVIYICMNLNAQFEYSIQYYY